MNIVDLDSWPAHTFPDANLALTEPAGLLAIGGDLQPQRLLTAYRSGIFPWYGEQDPILWWSPDPRAVLYPGHVHCSRRLRRKLRQSRYRAVRNHDFIGVMQHCAEPRRNEPGTWLHADMQSAYGRLHVLGHAHSVEILDADDQLVGGLYGVASGKVFFAESMFSSQTDGSKIALLALSDWLQQLDFKLIDVQMMTPHLASLGAVELSRSDYLQQLALWS